MSAIARAAEIRCRPLARSSALANLTFETFTPPGGTPQQEPHLYVCGECADAPMGYFHEFSIPWNPGSAKTETRRQPLRRPCRSGTRIPTSGRTLPSTASSTTTPTGRCAPHLSPADCPLHHAVARYLGGRRATSSATHTSELPNMVKGVLGGRVLRVSPDTWITCW